MSGSFPVEGRSVQSVLEVTIAAKDDIFDQLFRDSALVVELRDEAEKAEYVARDEELHNAIEAAGKRLFEPEFVARHLHVGDDWWPDHTLHVDASIDSFTQAYYDELRALLIGKFCDWRIQVVVYADPMDGKTMVGSIAIWADRVLIDRAFHALLVWRGIDLHCEKKPVWRESAKT
jgi:hypothetical protein